MIASITVQELRRWPNKPRRFSIERISLDADPQNRLVGVLNLRVGQILHLDEMAGMRVDGVNIIIQRGNS